MRKFTLLVLVLLAVSCTSPKKLTYLTDMEYGRDYPAPPAPELIIQVDDCLGIQVSSETPQLAAPFTLSVNASTGEMTGRANQFVVDNDGNIDFPVLGTIHAAGKTLKQLKQEIAGQIRDRGYIKDPIVIVTLDNFTVTVVGSISNHVLPVTGNSINLFQVLAASGGTNEYSKIKELTVIRTENGVLRSYAVDLQSKDVFESPVFYLKQQDIVYMKPQGSKINSSGQATISVVSPFLTLASIITNFLLWSSR